MEHLWSSAAATAGNLRQMNVASKSQEQAKSAASDCEQLRRDFHGKAQVDSRPVQHI
jgi:hypothetical protein